jgi:hypothetical protein
MESGDLERDREKEGKGWMFTVHGSRFTVHGSRFTVQARSGRTAGEISLHS